MVTDGRRRNQIRTSISETALAGLKEKGYDVDQLLNDIKASSVGRAGVQSYSQKSDEQLQKLESDYQQRLDKVRAELKRRTAA